MIRAFAREEFQEEKFAAENAVYAENSNKLFKLTGLTEPLFVQIIIAMIVAIVWFALDPLHDGSLKIGDLVAFIEYSFHALLSFLFLPISLPCILGLRSLAVVSRKSWTCPFRLIRMRMVSQRQHLVAIWNLIMSPLLIQVRRRVQFFTTFPFRPNLVKQLPLSVRPVLGKSSLVQLIPRFYDVTLGKILVDGVDVRDYNLKALRQKIGLFRKRPYSLQEPLLKTFVMGKKTHP